mmetsp:Transcript_46761/g.138145  ORF Transcript_46761/g.138145 Transcript_46761/m.138145 type:complete len:397 (-) Transcript_46761:226-1416(-)
MPSHRFHQHEIWDPPASRPSSLAQDRPQPKMPTPRVYGPQSFAPASDVDVDVEWQSRHNAVREDLFGNGYEVTSGYRPSGYDHGGYDRETSEDDFDEPSAICDGRPDSGDETKEARHLIGSRDVTLRSKFKVMKVGTSVDVPGDRQPCCSSRRIICALLAVVCGAVGVWLNRDALLGSVLDSGDSWNGRTEGVPVVLGQGTGFLNIEGYADDGETGVYPSVVASNSSIWIPVQDGSSWVFRSQSLVQISQRSTHWVDGDGFWYLSRDCKARNWNAEEQLFTVTSLSDHRFELSGLDAACGGPLSIMLYRDCTPLVDSCLDRCVSKFGKTIAEGNARYCAKGCAAMRGGSIASAEVYCYLPREERQASCMERCERNEIVDQEKMVPKCQYGCGFWAT